TRPSSRLTAHPRRPSWRATEPAHQRKPTPWTRPLTRAVSRTSAASPATSRDATDRAADWSGAPPRRAAVPAGVHLGALPRRVVRGAAALPLRRLRLGVGTQRALDPGGRGRTGLPRDRRRGGPPRVSRGPCATGVRD